MSQEIKQVEVHDVLIPIDSVIKICGSRFYRGSRRAERFLPISKKKFEKLNQVDFSIFQKIGESFIKIN